MYRVKIKGKFKERPINLGRAINLMFKQKFSGSIQQEHITWWKPYWIKSVNLEILEPKVFREGKPSVRVVTVPTSSDKRELLVLKNNYGGNNG